MFKFLSKQSNEDKELVKTSDKISKGFLSIFNGKKLDEDTLVDLEELLISADINVRIVNDIIKFLRENKYDKEITIEDIKEIIYKKLEKIFIDVVDSNISFDKKPYVIMFVGVNGSGKTTFIGKLANRLALEGKKVLLAACDTFRAGAVEQLKIWAEKSKVDIILPEKEKQDPASVAFKAYNEAKTKDYDVLLIDTAGRLQNNTNLMNELTKIKNVLNKIDSSIPHKVLLSLDATVGQNSSNQVLLFNEAVKIDGIIMNKLDGSAKGGVLISIVSEFKKPVVAIGIGEKIDDIRDFDYKDYLKKLLGL